MELQKHFAYNTELDLSAANIGVSRWIWDCIESEDENRAKEVMLKHRYAVLPISRRDEDVTSFFCTRKKGEFHQLNLMKISHQDKIYYRTDLLELIELFIAQERTYYFLSHSSKVVGLITISNLNCRAVYNFLYNVISDIEVKVSEILRSTLVNEDVLNYLKSQNREPHMRVASSYETLKAENMETSIFEHMGLTHLGEIIRKFGKNLPQRNQRLQAFASKFDHEGTIAKIRNRVMHPVRTLITNFDSLTDIKQLLDDYVAIKTAID